MSRKEDLLEAAMTHFSEKGYHRTTVADIVKTAGVAQGTFYLYFDSKKALFITLLESFFELFEEAILFNVSPEDFSTRDQVAQQVKDVIRRILLVYRDNAVLARIFLREAMGLDPDFVEVREAIMFRLAQYAAAVLDIAIAQKTLPPQNTQLVAHCIVGMIEHVADHWLYQDIDLELEELVNALARFEMLGIGGIPTPQMEKILEIRGSATRES